MHGRFEFAKYLQFAGFSNNFSECEECVSVCLKAASMSFELQIQHCVNRVYFASVLIFTRHSVGLRVMS